MKDAATAHDYFYAAFGNYGYYLGSEPLAGALDIWVKAQFEGLAAIEKTLASNAKRFGFRGRSVNAMAALHRDLPEPAWGVEVRTW